VAGASGLVGGRILKLLLEDSEVARVVAPTRRPLPEHPKLENPLLSGPTWPALPRLDEAYACLGTTRAKAGSAEAFRAVDLDLTVSFARAAKAAGARRLGLVSSVGADARSRLLYSRTKGEAEHAAQSIGFESLVIARPSLLLGERAEPRAGELVGEAALRVLAPLLIGRWRRYRAIRADAVASALVLAVRGRVPGALTLESDELAAI
jgi:uncharacterized protein YbjT (DUF2867 family)